MRTLLTAVLLALLATLHPVTAQPSGIGVGAQLATANTGGRAPVGLSVKTWINDRQAVSGATSFLLAEDELGSPLSFWLLEVKYLFHNFEPLQVEEGYLGLYIGPGIQYLALETVEDDFAFRAPIGVNYLFDETPVDLFIEVAPTLQITDPTILRFEGAIGVRYFFARSEEE